MPAVIVATLVCGAALGAVNGLLIGYLRLRAFITTLITLIIYRSAYDLLLFDYSNKIAAAFPDIPVLEFHGRRRGARRTQPWRWSISSSPCSGMSS